MSLPLHHSNHPFVLLISLVCLFAAGCGQPPNSPVDLSRHTMVFVDSTSSDRYTYLVSDLKVALIVVPASGTASVQTARTYYVVDKVSTQIYSLLRELSGFPGEMEPLSLPEGKTGYTRSLYATTRSGQVPPPPAQSYFPTSHPCQRTLAQVRTALEQKTNLTPVLPNWVFANEAVVREIGVQDR